MAAPRPVLLSLTHHCVQRRPTHPTRVTHHQHSDPNSCPKTTSRPIRSPFPAESRHPNRPHPRGRKVQDRRRLPTNSHPALRPPQEGLFCLARYANRMSMQRRLGSVYKKALGRDPRNPHRPNHQNGNTNAVNQMPWQNPPRRRTGIVEQAPPKRKTPQRRRTTRRSPTVDHKVTSRELGYPPLILTRNTASVWNSHLLPIRPRPDCQS